MIMRGYGKGNSNYAMAIGRSGACKIINMGGLIDEGNKFN